MANKELKRACCYCRVSTIKNQDTARQVSELKELALSQGYEIQDSDVFTEHISGFTKRADRPVFTKMMNVIRADRTRYDMVYIHEISRLSRNPSEGRLAIEELNDLGVPMWVKAINMCTLDDKGKPNMMFNIFFSILSEFARSEAEYFKSRAISGMLKSAKNGEATGGVMQPFGYRRNPDTKMLEIDEAEAVIVRQMYQYVIDGMGTKTIAKILNQQGIATRTQKALTKGSVKLPKSNQYKSTDEIEWVDGTVYSILTNTMYKGQRRYKDILIDCPAIVDELTWERAIQTMKERFDVRTSSKYLYILRGLITCSCCGRNYYGRYKPSGTDCYYMCISRRDGKSCGNGGINILALDSCVWDVVQDSTLVVDHVKMSQKELKSTKAELKTAMLNLELSQTELKELEKSNERLFNLYMKGKLSDSLLFEKQEALNKSIVTVKEKITKHLRAVKALTEMSEKLGSMENYQEIIKNIGNDRFQMAKVLNTILERVVVTSVNQTQNNREYIVSIFLRGWKTPVSIMIETKGNGYAKRKFIMEGIVKKVGHDRFKYVDGGFLSGIEYSSTYKLKTPVNEAVEMIKEFAKSVSCGGHKNQQVNTCGIVHSTNVDLTDEKGEVIYPQVIENIPKLIEFEEVKVEESVRKEAVRKVA